jgi:hypothetical protein
MDALAARHGLIERILSASGNDNVIAKIVQSLRKCSPDAGAAAGKENGVARRLHDALQLSREPLM